MSHRLGIDLGGSKIEAVLIAPDERIVLRNRIPTPRNREYTTIVDAVRAMIDDAARHVPNGQPCTLGLGIPGSINPATGLVHNANTTCLIGKPLQQDLERTLDAQSALKMTPTALRSPNADKARAGATVLFSASSWAPAAEAAFTATDPL